MLAGQKDALALAAVAGGLGVTLPMMAGSPWVVPGLIAPYLGSTWLGWKQLSRRRDMRLYQHAKENFTIASDPVPKFSYGKGGYRVGLTKDRHLPTDIIDDIMMRHFAIIGQSGVGKTVLGQSLLWQQTARGGGWMFIDAKLDRETRDQLGYMMKVNGRLHDLYVLDSSDPKNSNTYNPLLRGSGDEVASRLMNLLPVAEDNPGADHYRQSANYALSVIITCLKACKMVFHFGDLSILLQSPAALENLEMRTGSINTPEARDASRAMSVFLDQYRQRNKEGVSIDMKRLKDTLGGMAGRIATFAQGDFGAVMNHVNPEIDFTDIIKNGKAAYIMLPTMAKDTAALNLGKMIVSDFRTAVADIQDLPVRQRPSPPFMAFLDEMGSYVLYGVKTLFEQARSARICMIPGFQAFANLSVVSEDFAEIVIQNTWSKAFFKFGSKDAEMAADLMGKVNKYTESYSEGDNVGESSPVVRTGPDQQQSDGHSYGTTFKTGEEYRVSPTKITALNKGECFLQCGARVFHLKIPMVIYPKKVPSFRALRRNINIPRGYSAAPYASQYYNFLTAGDVKEMNNMQKKMEKAMLEENGPIQDKIAENNMKARAEMAA